MNVLIYAILFIATFASNVYAGGNVTIDQISGVQSTSPTPSEANSTAEIALDVDDTTSQQINEGTSATTNAEGSLNQNVVNEKLRTAENNPVANSLCRAFVLIKGYIIPIIVLLWIITGIGFFIGKISWGIVIALMVGTTLTVASSKMAASYILNDASGDIKDACECRFGVNCDSPYE
jgi:hypothetical protein